MDQQTAESIAQRCLAGPLLEGRTTLLVTHRTELCLHLAQQVVELSHGTAHVTEPGPGNLNGATLNPAASSDEPQGLHSDRISSTEAQPAKFIEEEYRAHGGVRASVYWAYIKAAKLRWWAVLICVLLVFRFFDVAGTWFLKSWGEAYGKSDASFSLNQSASQLLVQHWRRKQITVQRLPQLRNPLDGFPAPEVNIRPWLLCFFILAVLRATAFMASQSLWVVLAYTAGRQMFADVMDKVSHATFRFYDVTPAGRLMNRLTNDCSTVDGNLSNQFERVVRVSLLWVTSIIVFASVTPTFLVFSLALTASFIVIFLRFLPTSQSLRRLEMVSLSPLMSNFGQILYGMTTIRAFCAQRRFQDRVIAVTDTFQKMDHFYWTLQAWLMYRFDLLSACSTLILTLLAVYTGVSAGLTAFALTAASKFVFATHTLCRTYGQLQMDFVSVERVVEMLELEKEPPGVVTPPAWWPTMSGDIIFEDVTIRYAEHLDPSLANISLKVKAGANTALLGRTGSGKSTLALALLATTLPESGRILIDGIDISTVDKQTLRTRVTFLAQDPTLFPGNLRENLDPLSEHTDAECDAVLSKVADSRHNWTLETLVETGGRNLSQGQRQLIGLARAILRRSPIVIFDEATASIDLATSLRIQKILRDELSGCTILTIAHRLEAVQNADYCIILADGKVLRQGRASEMTNVR